MDSNFVIKVKYGDTLRRFNANIKENEELDLDMDSLRAKIVGFFNFPPDAGFTLTYIDEDEDVVTLADDDDLRDVMWQDLKFLRIDVQLNNDKIGKASTRSGGNSTPLRSPRVQNPLPCINNGIAEVLKSVPEPLRDVLSKLSLDLASKAVLSSNTVLMELVDCFSKMGQSNLNSAHHSQDGAGSNTQTGASEIPAAPSVPTATNASKGGGVQEVFPKSNPPSIPSQEGSSGNVISCPTEPHSISPAPFDINLDHLKPSVYCSPPLRPFAPANDGVNEAKKQNTGHSSGKPLVPLLRTIPSHAEYPFSGVSFANDPAVPPIKNHIFNKSNYLNNPMVGIFHRGVQCDGCGAHPITGPRYKSKLKEDYDLCSVCFTAMGNEADYIKMDRPMPCPYPPRGFNGHPQASWAIPQPFGPKRARLKLDSLFVSDVTVSDGTLMAPSTPFTKIWRMRNNGNVLWTRGVRLVWTGGDKFSNSDSVEITIPGNGVPVDGEIDIAADFVAPALPGRYISYWRMSYPVGGRFGQRVWVHIQVDASLKDPSLKELNLNEAPHHSGSLCPEVVDLNAQLVVDGCFLEPQNSTSISEPAGPVVDKQPKNNEQNFPINDALLVGDGVSAHAPPQVGSAPVSVSYPMIDMTDTALTESFQPLSTVAVDVPTSSEGVDVNIAVENSLLMELEEMGFKQVDLNKEILRRNEYDLQQSVDDLCGVAEWDPILEELQEMGFCDKEMNRKLLKKNKGSIKGVVMDILSREKA